MMRACSLLAVAACNQVYGLDPTTIREVGIDAPPDLEDEDLDGAPNDFDNCPGITNADQKDTDKDTVGDPCDPLMDPTRPDTILARYMFNRPLVDFDQWRNNGFTFRDGYVEHTSSGGDAQATMFTVFQPGGATLVVEARITVTEFDRTRDNQTGVILEGLGGDYCYVTDSATASGLYASTSKGIASGSFPPTDNIPFTVRVFLERTIEFPSLICQVGNAGPIIQTVMKPPDSVGVTTRYNAARIDYLVIYAH